MGNGISRIGLMFHETFKLMRYPMSQIMELSNTFEENKRSSLNFDEIKENSFLGNNYIKAFLPYCKGVGALNFKNNFLTSLGKQIFNVDPTFSSNKTVWLMHYHMSAIHGPGPEFWSELVREFFSPNNRFSSSDIKDAIATYYWNKSKKSLALKSVNSTASIFLNSYTDLEGLGQINILTKITEDNYLVNQPLFHNNMVLAYALCHYWEQMYPGNMGVTLDPLLQSDLPKLFLLSATDFETMLDELRSIGFLEIQRTAQPYQVKLMKGGDFALDQIYGTE